MGANTIKPRQNQTDINWQLMNAVRNQLSPFCDKWTNTYGGWDGYRYTIEYSRGPRHTELFFDPMCGAIEYTTYMSKKGTPPHIMDYRETLDLADPNSLIKLEELFKQHHSFPLAISEGSYRVT